MGFVEAMVFLHQTLHEIDEVPEYLRSAHSVEVRTLLEAVLQHIFQILCEVIDFFFRIRLVCSNAGDVVSSDLAASFEDDPEVFFGIEVARDDVAGRHAHGDRSVAVAELTVVVHLEAHAHAVILDIEGLDDAICLLDMLTQKDFETVLVDALSLGRAMEASEASALEEEGAEIDDSGIVRDLCPETSNHGFERWIGIGTIDQNHDILILFRIICGFRDIDFRNQSFLCVLDGFLEDAVFNAPDQVLEPVGGLLLTLGFQKVVHVRRQAGNIVEAQVEAVVADVVVGGDVVEVLGCGDLAGCLVSDIQKAFLHAFLHHADEAVKLARGDEGVDGVGEDDQVGLVQRLDCRGEILLQAVNRLRGIEVGKALFGEELLQVEGRVERDAVLAARASVDYEYVHAVFPHAANALALTCSITLRIPIHTVRSVKTSTMLP